ncbi:lipopolysaccharide biosynthesis protein [Pedobacter alpinus]|uniref:Lipopolysaccharide biosynthesis protein n=1 Tax=Pedobacter alpinus TaxID=1590643 RepID=A0ABW5TYA2_9SPHI
MFKNIIKKVKGAFKEHDFLKNAFSIFYLQTISSIIGFVSTFLLLKAIGVSGIGIIAILTTYVNFYIGIFSFQSYSAIIKFGQEAKHHNDILLLKTYIKRAFIQDVISSLITLIVAFSCIKLTSDYFEITNEAQKYIYIYLILIPFSIFRSVSAILRLNNDFTTGPTIAITSSVLRLISISVGTILNFSLSYFIISELIIGVLGYVLHIIVGAICLKKMNCLDFFKVKLNRDKKFTHFNIYNNLVSTLDLPTGHLTNFIINKLLGVEVFGVFTIISKFGAIFNQLISALTQSLFPELSKLVAERQINLAFKIVKKTFFVISIIGFLVSSIFMLTHKFWLFYLIPATTYNGYTLSIYTIYLSITGAVAGVHLLFVSLNFVKYNIPIVIFCNAIYIVLLILLSNWFGLIGAIGALLLQSILISSIKYFFMLKKVKEVKLSNV